MGANGNPEALARFRANLTPEQKAEMIRKSVEAKRAKRAHPTAQRDFSGLVVRVMSVRQARYVKGSCRSINASGVAWDTDEVQKLLARTLTTMKAKGLRGRKTQQVVTI